MINFNPYSDMVWEEGNHPNGLPLSDEDITLAVFGLSHYAGF